ncbi:MAG: nickel pincer cofactor biosynthesis protein LarB [Candidatus Lokiarchaeota archaeon]|nr:nickel pincer cofactor biosynthesis protein LarB [Candidatus Lokiarchaeota archaeon]
MKDILENLLDGTIKLDEAEKLLKANFIKEVDDLAQLDIFRTTRTGVPEVILAENKTSEILLKIVESYLEENRFVIISRFTENQNELLKNHYLSDKRYAIAVNELARTIIIHEKEYSFEKNKGIVGLITAGSSDIPIAEEAKIILKTMGCEVISSYDIGIAGIHRIFEPLSDMVQKNVDVIIVCAGMEGTLPGVVAALVDVPVIGVPVSSGYGKGGRGEGALITMLQSCSPGLVVVNIDNGFGAGASAALIAKRCKKN